MSIVAVDDQILLRLFADAELDIIVGPFSTSEQLTDQILVLRWSVTTLLR
ncbi:MAG: hypothetical protein VX095_05890 [Pseudomonadota bacterium]|nr:hypothetical protein [Pseudomonadota bacterium]